MSIFTIIIIILMFVAVAFSGLVSIGYNRGINIVLDKFYTNTTEMAYATVEELKKEGKQCEILEIGNGYPKLLVNGKKYILVNNMASAAGFPTQVIQLKIYKEKTIK